MDFLTCIPTVFVIGNEYEILVNVKEPGILSVIINGERYHPENSGVLFSEKRYGKIRIPQNELDVAGVYTVAYKKTLERKAYFSRFGEEEYAEFPFKPVLKSEGINIYHLADVHYRFEQAKNAASFFGGDVDMYIFNGDLGEVENEDNYIDICKLTGEISGGAVPVVFSRGNHDTRGKLAERYTEYFPSNGEKTYYTFEIGPFCGIVLDCGEDKSDSHPEYGGANVFESFRKQQTLFLKGLKPIEGKMTFAVSHICPADSSVKPGSVFDIEDETYREWNRELERLGVLFMLSGHVHTAYYIEKNSIGSIRPIPYHAVIASEKGPDYLLGTAITIYSDKICFKFTDNCHVIRKEFEIKMED